MTESVAELCRQKKITVEELAERAGLALDRAMAIVLGRWTPSPVERANVAAALDTTPDRITWGHQTPIQHLYGHGPG